MSSGGVSEAALFDGLTEGAKLRTESLFSSSSQLVVDASHVKVVDHDGLAVVPVVEVFSNPNATFLGFGFPNVFLALPRSEADERGAGWDRFAAFMYWRKTAYVADTKGRVQGGVFIEMRGLPAEATERLRDAMASFEGRRSISCANATGRVMSKAGFTCGGRQLGFQVRPMKLAKAIWDEGLEFDGRPVDLRVIRTNAGTVSDHFLGVWRKEASSLFRAAKKIVTAKKERARAPVIEPRPLAPAGPRTSENASHLELRVGRPTKLAALLRTQWGDHPILEARLDANLANIDSPEFAELSTAMKAYPGKLDTVSKLKRYLLFSKPVVRTIRYQLAAEMDSLGRLPGPTLVDMFQVGTHDKPFLYNMVMTGTSARMSRLENRNEKDVDKANWVLAKHVLLSGYDRDVRYAGEIWAEDGDRGRTLHLNDNSGTYKPSGLQAEAAARFLEQMIGVPVEAHSTSGADVASPDDDEGFPQCPDPAPAPKLAV